jgi:hypothetical protein
MRRIQDSSDGALRLLDDENDIDYEDDDDGLSVR